MSLNNVADQRSEVMGHAQVTKPSTELRLTWAAIVASLGSLLLLYVHLASAALSDSSNIILLLQVICAAVLVTSLMYGTFVYLATRLGYLRRADHALNREELEAVYDPLAKHSSVCILIPTYKEEIAVLQQTIISAALSEYPTRRIAVLIDDPARGSADEMQSLSATRALVDNLHARFREAAAPFRIELTQFLARQRSELVCDLTSETQRLVDLYQRMATTIEGFASENDSDGAFAHTDRFFREQICLELARLHTSRALELSKNGLDTPRIHREYRRLASLLSVEITSFERKRFENLSHAPNKAMNLNSYIGLIGKHFNVVHGSASSRLVETEMSTLADVPIDHADFLLTLDADSLIRSDYILKLAHHLERHPSAAVVQTPYSAIPGSINPLERAAGAQTDIQYITHQGFTEFNGTYWVGANALLRLAALRDVVQTEIERGQPISVFIQDRTVIEDTGSTIDLIRKGWLLHNHPERLAYSATPADFGSLIIQRRRWANGGLIIFSDLLRYATAEAHRPGLSELLMRAYYLCSPTLIGFTLLFLMLLPLDSALATIWLPCSAIPYFLLYARDLRLNGYGWADLPRVYALNLMLLPINLAGVFRSIEQMLFKRKMAFGRTPKVEHRTKVSALHIAWQIMLPAFLGFEAFASLSAGHYLLAACWGFNACLVLYGFAEFIGIKNAWSDLTSPAARLVPLLMRHPKIADPKGKRPRAIEAHTDHRADPNGRIGSIEGLRAYAVILVFLVHFMSEYFDRRFGVDFNAFHFSDAKSTFDLIGYYLFASHYGVDLFFLLSGFLIYRMVDRPDFNYVPFLRDRLIRLYPAFLFALALQLCYVSLAWDQSFDLATIAANVLMLHGFFELGVKPILVPTWSLTFEWAFYICFPLLVLWWSSNGRLSLTRVLLLAVVVMAIVGPIGEHYVRFVMFFAGAALASASPRLIQRFLKIPDWLVLSAFVLINFLFVFKPNYYLFIWPFAAGSFLLVMTAIYGNGLLKRLFCITPLRRLGDLSYSFFLLHGTVILAIVNQVGPMLRGLPAGWHFVVLIGLSFVISILCAQISYLLFEKTYFDRKRLDSSFVATQPAE